MKTAKLVGVLLIVGVVAFVVSYSTYSAVSYDHRLRSDFYKDGYEAGVAGQPPESCPRMGLWGQEDWLKGWGIGFRERGGK